MLEIIRVKFVEDSQAVGYRRQQTQTKRHSFEKCYTPQMFFLKIDYQIMYQSRMKFIILENMFQSHKIVTHHLRIILGEKIG
jgi:hypothetical protein